MFNKIIQIFKIKDLRNKILFVLAMLAIFRLMANIPIPGVNKQALETFFGQFQTFRLVNLFTGGALEKVSIVMLGVGPYITATIILQLLTMIFPQLEKMYREEGEAGRQKFNQYGRILTVPLAALQGYGMIRLFQRGSFPVIGHLSPFLLLASISVVTASSLFLMWLGELISEKGIGEGVSLLIFAGIIADFPSNISRMISLVKTQHLPFYSYLLFFSMMILIIAGVVLFTEARRNISVSYAKRVRGTKVYGGASTFLPININPAGVMPIIFALSILTFPGMIANFLSGLGGKIGKIALSVSNFLNPEINLLPHLILYFFLVCVFTYFYTAVTFDPKDVSENLQKMGGFIPGIRPGTSTASYLSRILNRILLIGALFLGLIAIMPSVVGRITKIVAFQFLIGGTGVLIIVSVVLDTLRQINAQLEMREYETL
ncbi:MAG: preprotein translocase subunit SecY [Candidatus Nealsonbacteria bacterium CG_4_10_14_0_8_um_filter_35_10]|uniref:Protein translocase subunit SecY n=1 Tax=Candidatus Nealsonbacteria bacterium CG_4_10_14_0_8_um_filter_35_10 TaxID=1974683 RepID=A0A2M7R7M8_9BACT|nr:MAG: preprotein translocase subunit SecY [Parcubacteria group bacterium CG1_02_36_42]PIY90819.1 MAG: preprotein translocase subunit SecY [Candidatus Nealsonbacteria bacterium CG_4_10_14_0_8_um_filter_35_10]